MVDFNCKHTTLELLVFCLVFFFACLFFLGDFSSPVNVYFEFQYLQFALFQFL